MGVDPTVPGDCCARGFWFGRLRVVPVDCERGRESVSGRSRGRVYIPIGRWAREAWCLRMRLLAEVMFERMAMGMDGVVEVGYGEYKRDGNHGNFVDKSLGTACRGGEKLGASCFLASCVISENMAQSSFLASASWP